MVRHFKNLAAFAARQTFAFERHFYKKLIVIRIFSKLGNLYLFHFLPLVKTKNKNQCCSKLVVWSQKMFMVIVYNDSQSTSKTYQIPQIVKKELYMLFLLV